MRGGVTIEKWRYMLFDTSATTLEAVEWNVMIEVCVPFVLGVFQSEGLNLKRSATFAPVGLLLPSWQDT